MKNIILQLDLGEHAKIARKFARDNPEMKLRKFLATYSARFPGREEPAQYLDLPMKAFQLEPVLVDVNERTCGQQPTSAGMRREMDEAWASEQAAGSIPNFREDEPHEYPETISDNEAVRIAYRQEMDAVADFLRNGLSVLVVCDKILTEFIYEFVCNQAGKKLVLETSPGDTRKALGPQLDQAVQGGPANPLINLPTLIHNLQLDQVLVLRSLDLLDTPPMIELLYQRSGKGEKPQILAFLDPSLEVKKVLTDRFAVHVAVMGMPRYFETKGKRRGHAVSHLLTREERARFARYDAEGLYKNVSGLNAIQFRNAMKYVGGKVAPESDPTAIYKVIRQFKTSSSEEIEIPDTTFDDIGGYEQVKSQLQQIVALVAGPIRGMSERQRCQLIPRGFIFHGPPGTGKTLFAKAIANEMNATIQMISGPEIMDKYVGQSENNLRRIFTTARRNAPAVVFFDEFDSIASQRSTYSDGGSRANNAVVAQFLTELDGFRQDQAVLIIGTTNRIDIIDEALLRPSRLRPIEIALPDYAARQRVANIHMANFGVDKLLISLFDLVSKHLDEWIEEGSSDQERKIPSAFLNVLFAQHPPYAKRYKIEEYRIGFLRDLAALFTLFSGCSSAAPGDSRTASLDRVTEELIKIGEKYGVHFQNTPMPTELTEEDWSGPVKADLRELFVMLSDERRRRGGLAPKAFLSGVTDLVAEYSEGFNNDEIRAIFQESSLDYHLEGQLITPRHLGHKIGLIKKRRDEREAVHLSARRGRR